MAKNLSAMQRLASLAGMPGDSTAAHEATAEQIALHRVDDAQAVPRPSSIGPLWVELEYDALRDEQRSLWEASGREATRQIKAEADGLRLAAEARERSLRGHEPVVDAAAKRYADTVEALSPFRRRPTGTKWLHYTAKAALLLGDMVGVTMMGINIGDYPILALLLSISAATAAVIAGLVGAELRDLRVAERRQREIDTLSPLQQSFQHVFSGVDDGKRMVKILCGVSAVIAFTIAAGIFAGRAALEGPLIGLIYGAFAAAVAAASLVESYMYADEIADQIDTAAASYKKELALHNRLASSPQWRERQQKISETASITSEYAARGEAADHRVRALKWSVLRRNTGVAGHGPALHPQGRPDQGGGER